MLEESLEIAKKAGDMYDKFAGFVEALEDVGDKLGKAQKVGFHIIPAKEDP